jgi:signal transduction histidine kinase
MREKAESLAELSVMEERNRIAYEIHDVVGHTLTAAIVQLEATKTLAGREGVIPEGKLDMLSGLVRKGLDDIRKSVRLLKTEESPALSLGESLRELIQYTEDTMDIRVDADIEIPHGLALGKLSEQVLYHALQEGLTNGIRHGRCSRFRFTLRMEGEMLLFRLVSDGEPFGEATPGFGLTSMKERAELLGGTVSIRSSAEDDGSPCGCELSIELPVG